MRLLRLLTLLLTLGGLASSSSALASGRWGCRAVYGPPLWGVCYAEQTLATLGPLEVALGLEARTWPEAQVSLYTLFGVFFPDWWATLELGRSPAAWRWAIGIGGRW